MSVDRYTWAVTADGVPVGRVADGGTIRRGRPDVTTQARAGYARLARVALEPTDRPLPLRALVTITCTPPAGSAVTVFVGRVTDTAETVTRAGRLATVRSLDLTATGPLGQAARSGPPAGGYPAQTDGARVRAALGQALIRSWEQLPGTWADLDGTWATIDPAYDESLLPDGLLLLAADPDPPDPYRSARDAAVSGGGLVYETADGRVGYQPADARGGALLTPTVLPAPLAAGVQARSSTDEHANRVEVEWTGGTAAAVDAAAQLRDGAVLVQTIDTTLVDGVDADERAAQALRYLTRPRPTVAMTWPLHLLTPAASAQLLALALGDYVQMPALPIDTDRAGFIEQVELNVDRRQPALTLTVSPPSASLLYLPWTQLPGTWDAQTPNTWDDYATT